MVACPDQLLQSRLFQPQVIEEHLLLIIIQLGDLFLDLSAHYKHFAALLRSVFADSLHSRIGSAVVSQVILRHICREDHRLRCQQIVACKPRLLVLVVSHKALCQLILFQMRFYTVQEVQLFCRCLIIPGQLHGLGDPSLQDFQIRKDQLQIDRLNVAHRINTSVYMHDICIFKAAHHMDDSIHLTDVCEELVSQAFSFGSSLHKPCDIHELDRRGDDLLRVIHLSENIQSLIRHCHHAHIWVDGTERIVR